MFSILPPFRRCSLRFGAVLLLVTSSLGVGWTPWVSLVSSVHAGSPPTFISPSTARGVVNQSFNYQIVLANFASATYTAEGLPDTLTLDPKVGAISGVPTSIETYHIKLTATNADGTTASDLTLTVEPALPPEITVAPVNAIAGQLFSYQITATNKPTAYTADGLPTGLSLDAATGLITGTSAALGTYTLNLSATNVRGTGTGTVQLNVVAPTPTVTLTTDAPLANPTLGLKGRLTLTRNGGDLNQPLTVLLAIKGSARNGTDYQALPLTKTFKPGKTVKRIHVIPINPDGTVTSGNKTVKVSLQNFETYLVGDESAGKVKIKYNP